ncbi:MAG: ATP-binding protein [Chloroflexi bacterium]|nr:MAG: ATP-binding protein [Chloroflexota bacterium]RLC92113.1 MAG: ATP-binding protein [Chloroflexota bacterium]HEY68156.1 Mrp/NBP35 family ATP-binding protein [Thermoflexia bacterium]
MITDKQILDALRGVMHPEIKHNLVELGMIKDVSIQDEKVSLTLALPFAEVPIKDDLVRMVKGVITKLDANLQVEVNLTEMSQKERAAFMGMAEGGPKPAQSANKITHVVAVLSGKGGVGKSSVAALLAVALRRQGKRVGVLDADITGPSIPKMFGLHEPPLMSPTGILPAETPGGIKVMSINLLLPSEDEAVIWRGPLISSAIKQFWNEVFWGELDCLIVDLPPGTSDASLTVMQSIPLSGVVLVTSPQDLAGMVVRKAARMAQHMGAPILGLVENMSYVTCPKCGEKIEIFGPSRAFHTALRLNVPLLGQLPLDPELSRRCDAGEVEDYPTEVFEPIAKQVMERVPVRKTTPIFP